MAFGKGWVLFPIFRASLALTELGAPPLRKPPRLLAEGGS